MGKCHCSLSNVWSHCDLAVPRYGQMTAGSYCYIGPQGIVHGTVVRTWGKLSVSSCWGGFLSQQLLMRVDWIAVRGSSGYSRNSHWPLRKKLMSFHLDTAYPEPRLEGICNQGLNLNSYLATICEVWIDQMCYKKTHSWLFSLAVLCSHS